MSKRAGDIGRDRETKGDRETRQIPGDGERQREAGRDGQTERPELVTATGERGWGGARRGPGPAAGGGGGRNAAPLGPRPRPGRTRRQPNDRRPARDAGPSGPEAAGSWRRGAGRGAASTAALVAVPRLGGP